MASAARAPLAFGCLATPRPKRLCGAVRLGRGGSAVRARELEELLTVGRRAARAQPRALRGDGGGDAVLDGASVAARRLEDDGGDEPLERLGRVGVGVGG